MNHLASFSNEEIIDGIKCRNEAVLNYIYYNFYPEIEYIILNQYNGTIAHAKDVFQDAMLTIYTASCAEPPLKIQYSFITYLATICKRRMRDELQCTKKEIQVNNYEEVEDSDPTINERIIEEERVRLFEKHFNLLGEKCAELLTLFFEGYSIKEITERLNMSSIQFTKNRRLQCKNILFKSIYHDPTLKELINGKPWTIREIPRW